MPCLTISEFFKWTHLSEVVNIEMARERNRKVRERNKIRFRSSQGGAEERIRDSLFFDSFFSSLIHFNWNFINTCALLNVLCKFSQLSVIGGQQGIGFPSHSHPQVVSHLNGAQKYFQMYLYRELVAAGSVLNIVLTMALRYAHNSAIIAFMPQ